MQYTTVIVVLAAVLLTVSATRTDSRSFQNKPKLTKNLAAGIVRNSMDIRRPDGEILITASRIRAYDWATHTVTLEPDARDKLAARLRKTREMVSGVPFVVSVGGTAVYSGAITTSSSSRSFSMPVILVDGMSIDETLGRDQIRIQFGYPSSEFVGKVTDPRPDERIRESLNASGKITGAGFTLKSPGSTGKEQIPTPTDGRVREKPRAGKTAEIPRVPPPRRGAGRR
jgi:hypothetical protein